MRVLLAQNDAVLRRALEAKLVQWGYEVIAAGDGAEALQILQASDAPKLALLDRNLSGVDGLEVCRDVRRRVGFPYVYLILLGTEEGKAALVEALNAGADEYLPGPLEEPHVRACLNAARRILDLQDDLIGAREALREQATHDSLTHLWNHVAILDILKRELDRGQRSGDPVGAIMADLDHFKHINDTYGHQAGDQVLSQVAGRLEHVLRPYDSIGRYGGEEFLIVLPGCDTPNTLVLAERLRRAICGKAILVPQGPLPVTISLGACSTHGAPLADMEALLRAADNALYQAKRTGRNRVERATPADVLGRRSG